MLIVGRSLERGVAVLSSLNEANPGAGHAMIQADLALLRETAFAAEEIARRTNTLDAVVLCAGVLFTRAEWTEETLERGFVLNYLSRYLVLRRLLPLLSPAPSARVVLVANAGRYRDTLDMNDLQLRRGGRGLRIAGRIQFANDLLGVALAERVHAEGILVATDVFRNARGAARPVRTVAAALQRLLGTPPAVAAQTPVVLVTDPDPAGLNGAVGVSLAVRYAGTDARHSGPPARPSSLPGRQPLLPLLALCETTGRS